MQINGTAGNDTLVGTNEDDQLDGQAGNDSLSAGGGFDFLTGGAGNDTLDGGADFDWASYVPATGGVDVHLGTGRASGADGSDVLLGIEALYGSEFDDRLTGDAGANVLNGRLGNDTLDGGDGIDQAVYWDATAGVQIDLGAGKASGADGNDLLIGIERVVGSAFADVIAGDGGDNELTGAAGADTLSGGGGIDQFGFAGNAPGEVDRVTDIANGETLSFGTGLLAVLIQSGDDASGLLNAQVMVGTPRNGLTRVYVGTDTVAGADIIVDLVGSHPAGAFSTDLGPWGTLLFDATLNEARHIEGTDGGDNLKGGNQGDTLDGDDGDDTLAGSAGNDLLLGDDGFDLLTGGAGDDTLDGGDDSDWIFYIDATGPVRVDFASGRASGADGNDVLRDVESVYGSEFADVLIGDAGDNYLNGRRGNDTLTGGDGIDSAAYWDASGAIVVDLAAGRAEGADGQDALSGIENVSGSGYNDRITGDANDNKLYGSPGDDTLLGAGGRDELYGDDGNDQLAGGSGDDQLDGGAGNDTLDGGAGDDTVIIDGAPSRYVVTPNGAGTYTVTDKTGVQGTDALTGIENLIFIQVCQLDGGVVSGGDGFDLVTLETASSAVVVDLAQGKATGASGSNALASIEGAIGSAQFGDTLIGSTGDNQLKGLGGDDQLDGGSGDDRLDGGTGMDTMVGGSGSDTYHVDSAQDVVVETTGAQPAHNHRAQATEDAQPALDAGAGVDKVIASISYTLGAFVENLDLAAGAGNLTGQGNELPNELSGNTGDNTLLALSGNDTLLGAAGNDLLDGGSGVDLARYEGTRTAFTIARTAQGLSVVSAAEGADTLTGVERLAFSDHRLAFDLDGDAGRAAKLLGAVFGRQSVANKSFAGVALNLLDAGMGYEALAAAALDVALGAQASDQAVVTLLFTQVVGQAPDAATLSALTGLLAAGGMSRGALAVAAAETALNQANIDLVGLSASGLAYA